MLEVVAGLSLQAVEVDALGFKHAHQFLKGQHEVHVAADGAAAGLQLLGGAGAHKGDLDVPAQLVLGEAGGQHHGGHGHADVLGQLREQLLGHHAPAGAAAGGHEGLILRHLTHEVLRFLNGAKVRAHSHFQRVDEAQLAHGGLQLAGGQARELVDKGGSHDGVVLVALADALNKLEDLALVHNGAKGAVHKAHAAGNALVVVDLRPAQFVRADGVHAAGGGAGALHLDDGVIGAHIHALAALDALVLIDHRAAAGGEADGVLGADLLAGVGKAAAAHVGHLHLFGRAGRTGELDDVDERRVVVFAGDHAVLDARVGGRLLVHRAQGQAHGQADALGNDGPFQKDAVAVGAHLTGNDLVRQLHHLGGVVLPLVGKTGHLGEYLAANVGHGGVDTAHCAHKRTPFRNWDREQPPHERLILKLYHKEPAPPRARFTFYRTHAKHLTIAQKPQTPARTLCERLGRKRKKSPPRRGLSGAGGGPWF